MKLNRNYNQRKALFKVQLNALIETGKLTTTEAKAKTIKPLFDKLITKAKVNSLHARRQLASTLSSSYSANRLVDTIAPLFADKTSGFTSIAKTGIRKGDGVTLSTLKLTAELPKKEEPKKEKKEVKAEKKVAAKKTK